jgi:hypothetical protein
LTQRVAKPLFAAAAREAEPAADASNETQAMQAAQRIARLVPTFTNYRSQILRASWITDPLARWSIRDNATCLQSLHDLGVPARAVSPRLPTPIPAPVEITGPVAGVSFRMVHANRSLLMSCELAARLPLVAHVLASHDVHAVDVISSYRDHPFPSFHTFGLALDLARFITPAGTLDVLSDFEKTPHHATCSAPPPVRARARTLREIACELGDSKRFSSVLTPNYNPGHRDHFHLDIRPDDERIFVR